MWTDQVKDFMIKSADPSRAPHTVIIFGIESHICVQQTTLDLLDSGYQVVVLVDGVSSCNRQEVPIALERMVCHIELIQHLSVIEGCGGDLDHF